MNNHVAVQGTGIVDLVTLGDSEISWNANDTINGARVELNGDLEVIINGKNIKAHLFQSARTTLNFEEPARFLLELKTGKDCYVISTGQLKRYFHEQIQFNFAFPNDSVKSWDDIFKNPMRTPLIPNVGAFGIVLNGNGTLKVNKQELTKLVRMLAPYWKMPNDAMMVLETLEPLQLIPKDISTVHIALDGSMYNHSHQGDVILDGTKYYAGSGFTLHGNATGKVHLSHPPLSRFPVSIRADYAKIGTGDLNLERTERDGQVMVISSRTYEELQYCTIDVKTDPSNPIYQKPAALSEEKLASARFKKSVYETFEIAAALGMFGGVITYNGVLSAAGFCLAGLFGLLAGLKNNDIKSLEHIARLESLNAAAQLHITYSGRQTSRWLYQYPEYRQFAQSISANSEF